MTDFRVSEEGILAGYSGSSGAVSVPVTVSKVGTAAFSGRPVTSVTLPTTTTEIRDDAFSGCSSLMQMTIPTAQKFIGANAFAGTGILSQPSNPQLSDSTITWSVPTNVPRSISSYNVYVNGQQSTSATATVALSQLATGRTNTIQIAAVDFSGEGIRSTVLEHASTELSWAAETAISRVTNLIAMSANGNRVAIADTTNPYYSNVYIYDITSDGSWAPAPYPISEIIDGGVSSITMSADGSTIVVARENRVRTYTEAAGWGAIILMDHDYEYLTTPPNVALSADGQTLAVGWPYGTGSVSIFKLNGVTWSLAKKVYGSLDSSENFGCSVALSEDGTTLAVGAKYAMGTGAVRVFTGSEWITQTNFYGEEGSSEQFGYSVSISANGSVIAVGSPCTGTQEAVDGPMAGYGSASVWSLQSGVWRRATTFYGEAGSNDMFGISVAANATGTSVIVAGKSGNACVFASNAGTWPLVASCAGTNSVAISNTGDRVICGGATAKSYSYRTEKLTVIPSICALLGAAAVKDAATATAAAHNLLTDIILLESAGITLTSGAIGLFASALPTVTVQSSLAALLIAGNLLAEPQNDFKPILHALCRSTFQLAADTYIGISSEFVSAIVQSSGPTNFISGYNPTSLYVFFPSGTSITPNTSYANVLFCLEPGVEYSFGSTTLTYRRKSELEQLLLALPNSASFVPPDVPLFSDAAIEWRKENIYAQATLQESAVYWLTQSHTVPDTFITLAWLSLDMLLSSDTETQKFGEAIGAKYIPYARGVRKIAAFSDGGADASLEYIPSGYFVGTADGSIAYPSTIQLIHTAALKRIDAAAFDAAITAVIINGKSFTVQNGNITLPYDNTQVWSININGPEILLPGAPNLVPTNGIIDISSAVMYIPANYFVAATVSYVNFPVAKSTDMVEIGKNAFPFGTKIIVGGVETDYYSYDTRIRLTRLSGIFYTNFGENARRAWYKSPLVTTDNVVVIPARTDEEIDITTSSLVTYDIKDEPSSDMYLWTHKPALLRKTASGVQSNRFQYDNTTYFYYSRTQQGTLEEGLNIGVLPGNKPTLKLLSSYVKGFLSYQRNIWKSGMINTVGKVGIPLRLDNRTLFSPFNMNQFANGQQYVIGNVSWLNNKSGNTSNPRITSILTTPTTRGNIVIEGILSELYPYMFGPWAKSVSAVLSAATSGKHTALTIPAFAFKNCRNMKTFDIISMGTIGESAFENCSSLEGAISVENTTSNFIINTNAFKNCSNISSLHVNNQYDVSIYANAFKNCSSLTTITLNGERGYGYTPDISIAANAFAGCSSITDITMKGNSAAVSVNAFSTCNSFYAGCAGDIAISSNAVGACNGAFTLDSSFGTVSVSSNAVGSCNGQILIKANSVSLAANAFADCSEATSIIITSADTVSIGESAFAGCTGATSITINATGAVSLAANAFAGCSGLMSITINGSTVSINSSAFTGCTGCRFIIVSGLETSDPFPFATMLYLQTVQIGMGAGLVSLSTMAGLTSLTSVVTTGNQLTLANNQFAGCSALHTLSIGNSLSEIRTDAFNGCSSLQSLTLNFVNAANAYMNTLTTCTSLTSIQINGGARLCVFDNFCGNLTNLSSVNLTCQSFEYPPNGNMFSGCTGLQTLRIAVSTNPTAGVFKIGSTLAGLKTLELTGAITVDGSSIFWNNSVLEYLTIRGTLNGLLDGVIPATTRVINVNHSTSQRISEYKYANREALQTVNITPLVDISEGAFFGCTNLTTVNLDATESLGNWAFANSGISGELIIPENVTYFGRDYCIGCPNLKKITYNCDIMMFDDPTLIKEETWLQEMYRNTTEAGLNAFDVSGVATITRGEDLSYNILYTPASGGADITINNSVYARQLNWSRYTSRSSNISLMLDVLMDCYDICGNFYITSNANDAAISWLPKFIYDLQDIGNDSEQTKETLPNITNFGGWNGSRFVAMDASANAALSSLPGMYSLYESRVYPTVATHFTDAIQDNQNLFTVITGDTMTELTIPYRVPVSNPTIKVPRDYVDVITDENHMEADNRDVYIVWPSCPRISLDDNTHIDISGGLRVNITENASTNLAAVLRWIFHNISSLAAPNNISIAINNMISTIEDLSFKRNTRIDISCGILSIYDNAMTDLDSTDLYINSPAVYIGNNAFNYWKNGSALIMRTGAQPCVGIDVFSGSDNITIDSDRFLINTPIVKLVDFSTVTMDDVPEIIEQHTDISSNCTRDIEIGTYIPESSKGFPKGCAYIKFQAVPSLQIYFLLQKPEDWFWAYHRGSDRGGSALAYQTEFGYKGDGTVQYINVNDNPQDEIYRITGLSNSFAPDTFSFMGYTFSRNVGKETLAQPNTYFRSAKAVNNQALRSGLYQNSPGGRLAGTVWRVGAQILSYTIMIASLISTVASLGAAAPVGAAAVSFATTLMNAGVSASFGVASAIFNKYVIEGLENLATTGVYSVGKAGAVFWLEISFAVGGALLSIFSSLKVFKLFGKKFSFLTGRVKPGTGKIVPNVALPGRKLTRQRGFIRRGPNAVQRTPSLRGPNVDIADITTALPTRGGLDGKTKVTFAPQRSRMHTNTVGRKSGLPPATDLDIPKTPPRPTVKADQTPTGGGGGGGITGGGGGGGRGTPTPNPFIQKPGKLTPVNQAKADRIQATLRIQGNNLTPSVKAQLQADLTALKATARGATDFLFQVGQMLFVAAANEKAAQYDLAHAPAARTYAHQIIDKYDDLQPPTEPITLNQYAEYISQQGVAILAGIEENKYYNTQKAYHSAGYFDAFTRVAEVAKPIYISPVGDRPHFHPESGGTPYHISNFLTNGTNYTHTNFERAPNGYPCMSAITASPLLTRWEYFMTHAFLGSPTTINDLEYNEVYPATGAASYNEKAIITVLDTIDSELYLGNRTVEYTANNIEAPNMVYGGANNIAVVIPNSITSIPAYAFNGTNEDDGIVSTFKLSSVFIPPTVTSIGKQAFYRSGLTSLVYPSGATIADYTFANTGMQQSISMPANAQTTLYDARNITTSITTSLSTPLQLSFTKNVIGIQGFNTAILSNVNRTNVYANITNGSNKLLYIKNATDVYVENVSAPGGGTFTLSFDIARTQLMTMTNKSIFVRSTAATGTYFFTPSTVIRLVGSASVMTVDGITSRTLAPRARDAPGADIAAYSFMGNETLMDFEFSPYCTEIGEGAFLNCKNLRSTLNLPVGLRKIGKNAFAGTNISGIIIPHTVEVIGEGAIPDGIRIILLADAHDQVSSALPSISSQMESAEAVLVPTSAAMQNTFEIIKHAPLRLDQRPLPPINPIAQKAGDGGLLISWKDITGAFASPATRHSIICTAEGEDDRHFMDVKSPFRITGLTNETLYTIYVIGHNDIGESPQVKVRGTPSA